jgi:S-DNA-T family DNA segregation ATPase FtsK/SpoIIIE
MPVRKAVKKERGFVRTVKPAVRARHPQLPWDISGIALIAVGLLSLSALVSRGSAGAIGDSVANALTYIAGFGAWVFPPLMAAVGVVLILDRSRKPPADIVVGAVVVFASFLGMLHIGLAGGAGKPLVAVGAGGPGGVIGALVASAARKASGGFGSWILLAALAVCGALLAANAPLVLVLRKVKAKVSACLRGFRERLKRRRERALNSSAKREASKASKSKPNPFLPRRVLAQGSEDASEELLDGFSPRRVHRKEQDVQEKPEEASQQQSVCVETSLGPYELPPMSILPSGGPLRELTQEEREENVRILEETLAHFNIEAKVVEISHGPTVTRYEIQLAPGIRVKRIESLADNIAMDLAAIYVRVEAPIPGKCAIGVEVPNRSPETVLLRDVIDRPEFMKAPSKLTIPLGLDVAGNPVYADLAKMPHLLIGGATNSGKSVCLNSMISGLLFRATPDEVKLLLIDPKKVELSLYDGIPHLVYPVVKDVRQAAGVLRWAEKEMHRRYDLLVETSTRNIDGYNRKVGDEDRLPYIVVVIDELADLMLRQGPEVEASIASLAQLARAVGIHLVIATQRPSVDVITGTIKANISSRIAFAVASHTDSRTILDKSGAERLVGRGDMLFLPIDAAKPIRVQGAYIGESEIEALVSHLKKQGRPDYIAEVVTVDSPAFKGDTETDDELFEQAVRLVVNTGHASTSMLQRKFKIGYTRAARLVDIMEERGIVGPLDSSKPREILLKKEDLDKYFRERSESI